ncbi:MAG: hypothetical protein ACK5UI_02495 [Bacteroidota bacterium]|jgi:hypothetical protein
MKLKAIVYLIFSAGITATGLSSCTATETKSNDPQPQQIISTDSSEFNGRLKADVRTSNNNPDNNAVVYLYASYEDMLRGLPLNFITTNSEGIADFGFLLQGNYYLFARNFNNSFLRDTAAVQVMSRREIVRTLRLTNQ